MHPGHSIRLPAPRGASPCPETQFPAGWGAFFYARAPTVPHADDEWQPATPAETLEVLRTTKGPRFPGGLSCSLWVLQIDTSCFAIDPLCARGDLNPHILSNTGT